jgi:hypothetical protein
MQIFDAAGAHASIVLQKGAAFKTAIGLNAER